MEVIVFPYTQPKMKKMPQRQEKMLMSILLKIGNTYTSIVTNFPTQKK